MTQDAFLIYIVLDGFFEFISDDIDESIDMPTSDGYSLIAAFSSYAFSVKLKPKVVCVQ